MSLSLEQIRHVASLARLELTDAELQSLLPQLEAIIEYVETLRGVPTEGVEPLAHPLPVENVFRADELIPSLAVDDALMNAPSRQGAFFTVPAVFDVD